MSEKHRNERGIGSVERAMKKTIWNIKLNLPVYGAENSQGHRCLAASVPLCCILYYRPPLLLGGGSGHHSQLPWYHHGICRRRIWRQDFHSIVDLRLVNSSFLRVVLLMMVQWTKCIEEEIPGHHHRPSNHNTALTQYSSSAKLSI